MSEHENPQQITPDRPLDARLDPLVPSSTHLIGRPFLASYPPALAISATDAARFLLIWSLVVVEHRSLITNYDEYESVAAKALDRLENDENSGGALTRAEITIDDLRSTASRERVLTEFTVGYDRLVHRALHRTTDRHVKLTEQVRRSKERVSILEERVKTLETQLKGDTSNRLDWERAHRKRQRDAEKELRNVRPKLKETQSDLRQAEQTIGKLKHESEELREELEAENRALNQQIVAQRSEGRLQLLCNICMSSREACATRCGHIFCDECLDCWSKRLRADGRVFSCPCCRKTVEQLWTPLWY